MPGFLAGGPRVSISRPYRSKKKRKNRPQLSYRTPKTGVRTKTDMPVAIGGRPQPRSGGPTATTNPPKRRSRKPAQKRRFRRFNPYKSH